MFVLRAATLADAAPLCVFAREMFRLHFTHYDAAALEAHFAEYYTAESFLKQLADAEYHWCLVEDEGAIIGYSKYGKVALPVKTADVAQSIELCRLYVAPEHKGKGLGKTMLAQVEAAARAQGAPSIYLGVYEQNIPAQKFYLQHGFSKIGEYDYLPIGDVVDCEWIMGKAL